MIERPYNDWYRGVETLRDGRKRVHILFLDNPSKGRIFYYAQTLHDTKLTLVRRKHTTSFMCEKVVSMWAKRPHERMALLIAPTPILEPIISKCAPPRGWPTYLPKPLAGGYLRASLRGGYLKTTFLTKLDGLNFLSRQPFVCQSGCGLFLDFLTFGKHYTLSNTNYVLPATTTTHTNPNN